TIPANQRADIQAALVKAFGKPKTPTVANLEGDEFINEEVTTTLKLDNETLARGSNLYRRHCLHCHGLTGNGQGPTAPWVNPHPRDYRIGKFKFTSSKIDVGERK